MVYHDEDGWHDDTPTRTQPQQSAASMKFIAGLRTHQLEKLRTSGVVFSDFTLGSQNGILLDADNAARIVGVLDLGGAEESESEYDGISRMTLKAKPSAAAAAAPAPRKPTLDAQHEQYRQAYIAACSARNADLLNQAREGVVAQRKEVENLQASLVRQMRTMSIDERRAKGQSPVDRSAYAEEFDAIFQVPKVRDVRIEPGAVNIYTEMLYATDPRSQEKHEIGEFLIKIYIDGQADAVRWFNMTQRIDACRTQQQAPHVWNSGRASFSEVREVFPDLIADLKFSAVAQLAIEFIEQVNVEDLAGEQIVRWPLASK